MITSVKIGKSRGKTFYIMMTKSKNGTIREYRYNNSNVPKTVLKFIQTTPYQHTNNCLLFRYDKIFS